MRKILISMVVLAVLPCIFAVSGCGNGSAPPTPAPSKLTEPAGAREALNNWFREIIRDPHTSSNSNIHGIAAPIMGVINYKIVGDPNVRSQSCVDYDVEVTRYGQEFSGEPDHEYSDFYRFEVGYTDLGADGHEWQVGSWKEIDTSGTSHTSSTTSP